MMQCEMCRVYISHHNYYRYYDSLVQYNTECQKCIGNVKCAEKAKVKITHSLKIHCGNTNCAYSTTMAHSSLNCLCGWPVSCLLLIFTLTTHTYTYTHTHTHTHTHTGSSVSQWGSYRSVQEPSGLTLRHPHAQSYLACGVGERETWWLVASNAAKCVVT